MSSQKHLQGLGKNARERDTSSFREQQGVGLRALEVMHLQWEPPGVSGTLSSRTHSPQEPGQEEV